MTSSVSLPDVVPKVICLMTCHDKSVIASTLCEKSNFSVNPSVVGDVCMMNALHALMHAVMPCQSFTDTKPLALCAEGLGAHLPGTGDCHFGLQPHEPRHAHC